MKRREEEGEGEEGSKTLGHFLIVLSSGGRIGEGFACGLEDLAAAE